MGNIPGNEALPSVYKSLVGKDVEIKYVSRELQHQDNCIMKSKHNLLLTSALLLTLSSWPILALADTPTDEIKVGTVLDESGIRMFSIGKSLPLPPGKWEVVSRRDATISLTGGHDDSAPKVALTLRNVAKERTISAIVLTYVPGGIRRLYAV